MLRPMLVSLNGQIVPAADATVSVFDRGFLFGDGIYEGLRAFDGWVRHLDDHCARMQQGLEEAGIAWDPSALPGLCEDLLEANGLQNAFLYWQITRGTPGPGMPLRARLPEPDMAPTVFGFCMPLPGVEGFVEPTTCTARTVTDDRWQKGHVKTISLMANIMAALDAAEGGADEALLVRDGWLSESCATNVFVVLPDDDGRPTLVTPPTGDVSILSGVTRRVLLELLPEAQVRMISEEELHRAEEIFLVGTITTVRSVLMLNGRPVGTGSVGPVAREVLARYADHLRSQLAERRGAAVD